MSKWGIIFFWASWASIISYNDLFTSTSLKFSFFYLHVSTMVE